MNKLSAFIPMNLVTQINHWIQSLFCLMVGLLQAKLLRQPKRQTNAGRRIKQTESTMSGMVYRSKHSPERLELAI